MQNLNPGSGDNVSASEAQEILSAWANRMAAQNVDPGVGSVQALATGLGVSEDHIRHMLEDIRVHKRSQQIAAGIIDQQQQQRKKSDVNAAVIAAIVLVAMVLIAIPTFLYLRGGSTAGTATTPAPPDREFRFTMPEIPPIPPITINPVFVDTGSKVSYIGTDGHTITAREDGTFKEINPSGSNVTMRGKEAIEHVKERIAEEQKNVETMSANTSRTEDQEDDLKEAKLVLSALESSKKVLEAAAKTGTPAPAPDPEDLP